MFKYCKLYDTLLACLTCCNNSTSPRYYKPNVQCCSENMTQSQFYQT